MKRIQISTVLVVLTVILAGCSGGGVTDSGDTDTDGTDAPGTDSSTAGMPTADGGPPTGTSLTQSYQVDLDANRSLQRLETASSDGSFTIETFVTDGRSYTKYGDGDDVRYASSDRPRSVVERATGRASGFTSDLESDASFVGTETYDGVTVSRYEYDNTAAWQTYGGSLFGSENVSVTEFTVAVLVDSDGVARLTTWTLSGEADDGTVVSSTWNYSVTGIGSTTVSDPAWLAEAQTQTA